MDKHDNTFTFILVTNQEIYRTTNQTSKPRPHHEERCVPQLLTNESYLTRTFSGYVIASYVYL